MCSVAISKEEIEHIAVLCRIELTPEETGELSEQLSHILEQFQVLEEVDTTGVEVNSHSMELQSVMREDDVLLCLDKEDVLANAPQREGDYFKVNVVLEE